MSDHLPPTSSQAQDQAHDPTHARAEFERVLNTEPLDLIAAALCIAAEHHAGVDPEACRAQLDKMAQRARKRIDLEQDVEDIARGLCELLHRQIGFGGASDDYYNPDNSYFDRVLSTRRGIPITLALVYIAVGQALGLNMAGISFPTHFLVSLRRNSGEGPQRAIIDPFSAQVLNERDCRDLLEINSAQRITFKPEHLEPVPERDILQRMLTNLKMIYLQRGDFSEALSICDRLLLVDPDSAQDLLHRAQVLEKLNCPDAAANDLEHLLALQAQQEHREAIEQKLATLRSAAAKTLH